MEQILSKLNTRDTIQLLDLSYKNIKELPDLSRFKVRKLNISHNNLDTLNMKNLPNYLVDLDASFNKINDGINFQNIKGTYSQMFKGENNISKYIKRINLSNNEIEGISFIFYEKGIESIVLSNNNLDGVYLYLKYKKLNYLDVSNNPKLSNLVTFDPANIDTVKSNNIAIDAPLKFIEQPQITTIPDKN
ncbi:leucine-rich repeat domain-containing protein [Flavobacterium undicola]|uniref:hypothetical protein n=1 Tax=Flavobacterium undicola TaxID=1932779 RepID=UPI001378FAC4|nr:hypothetical protein [Flavobacterium undicola]MBA0882575.1 hypothetical protein [Flavobacterium undicola]